MAIPIVLLPGLLPVFQTLG